MSSREREILLRDSRSENMLRRLIQVPSVTRRRRQRRLLIATSGCILRCPREVAKGG